MPDIRREVLAAKKRLTEELDQLRQRHRGGCSGELACRSLSDSRDGVLRELFGLALKDLGESGGPRSDIALVAHGGYGRREVAPYSDVDLMILHAPPARQRVVPLASRLLRDVFDAQLDLGHSVRTPEQAAGLACRDPRIATSLMESRLLAGGQAVFSEFVSLFRRQVRRQSKQLINSVLDARRKERARYGETVYLLEPNVKRSGGALRDLHLLRWIGFARFGTPEPRRLRALDVLSEDDLLAVESAREFLLRLRNEMHFHAGRPADVLDRGEQLRIARHFGSPATAGMLPVEQLMRDYFRHTGQLSHVSRRFVDRARSRQRLSGIVTAVFGHQVEPHLRAGPAGLLATQQGLRDLRGSLTTIVRMADLANLYDKPIAAETWEVVRREASGLPRNPCDDARRHFLSLLSHPARLGGLLRDLHEVGVLERFIPAMEHARGLLQFNQYHKYTVDEHCIRAVESATRLLFDKGPLGHAYQAVRHKHVLHLALLIHDLGKGFEEDHCELGLQIAGQTARRLGLAPRETATLEFLVHQHQLMNHLAFRRDVSDEQLVVRFARQVGSPQNLQMLFVLTAADLDAVGPGVWDGWKADVLGDLYGRAMRHLAADGPVVNAGEKLRRLGEAIAEQVDSATDRQWFLKQAAALPGGYLGSTEPGQIVEDLRLLRDLGPGEVNAQGVYLPKTGSLLFSVAARERKASGIFHKLTGALTRCGLRIRFAQINTIAGEFVLDRFWVFDPDYADRPPPDRLEQIRRALIDALRAGDDRAVAFRRTWQAGADSTATRVPPRVAVDNATSPHYTILDVFAHDRAGLLYAIARALFDLGLSVWRAKIGTYLDQVVDVFYVTDARGGKVEDESRLEEIGRRLSDTIKSTEAA